MQGCDANQLVLTVNTIEGLRAVQLKFGSCVEERAGEPCSRCESHLSSGEEFYWETKAAASAAQVVLLRVVRCSHHLTCFAVC